MFDRFDGFTTGGEIDADGATVVLSTGGGAAVCVAHPVANNIRPTPMLMSETPSQLRRRLNVMERCAGRFGEFSSRRSLRRTYCRRTPPLILDYGFSELPRQSSFHL